MANKETEIFVFDSFSESEPRLIGSLFVNNTSGNETYSFEYDDHWLASYGFSYFLDPDIQSYAGRQFPRSSQLFGLFADSSPDRWGRVLMTKKERIQAEKENRKPKKLNGSDYLLGVYDEARMGGLRFKLDLDGPFLSYDTESATPPWAFLRTLEEASRQFEKGDNSFEDKWLAQLIRPGSSLGGARPKATVVDPDGQLWIAKFPSKNDEYNVGAWEKVAADLAELVGLNVPETKLENFSKYGSTFLVKRFDRDGNRRIHYASAMTMLGKTDGASAADGISYLDIASFIRSSGAKPNNDLLELWKRIVFSMLISNTDDHLRNHAFLLTKEGWVLSPLYDVNPTPYGDTLALNVNELDNRISLNLAIESARYYDIQGAEQIVREMKEIVRSNYERLATKYGVSRSEISLMKAAFSASEC